MLHACLLHCIRGNVHSKFLVDLALFSFCSNLICCWSAEDGDGGCPPLLPDSFSDRPRNYNDLNLPVDSVYDSSDPDEKTLMLVAIFRLNVKSSRCQSHAGDISIFLKGQAFAANAPVAWCSLPLSGESPHLRDRWNTLYSQHGLLPFLWSAIPPWGSISPTPPPTVTTPRTLLSPRRSRPELDKLRNVPLPPTSSIITHRLAPVTPISFLSTHI